MLPSHRSNVTAAVVAGTLFVMVLFDSTSSLAPLPSSFLVSDSSDVPPTVYIASVLYRNWRALRGSDSPSQIPLNLLFRVGIFSLVCVAGIGCAIVFLSNVSFFAGNVIIALSASAVPSSLVPVPAELTLLSRAVPLIAFLVFGTQKVSRCRPCSLVSVLTRA